MLFIYHYAIISYKQVNKTVTLFKPLVIGLSI